MSDQSFAQSVQMVCTVLSRTLFISYSWIVNCFVRVLSGQMSMTYCLIFIFIVNAVYFFIYDWLAIASLFSSKLAFTFAIMPLSLFTLVSIWQCAANIHSRFVRFVARLLIFVISLHYIIYVSLLMGVVDGVSLQEDGNKYNNLNVQRRVD